MYEIANERKQFWQWDTGQRLIVGDNVCSEVHFCNGMDECSLVCGVYEEEGQRFVNVPNILLQTAQSIKVFSYIRDENEQYTKYQQMFVVLQRTKPADYVYTETETKTWDSLNERLSILERSGGFTGGIPAGGKAGQILYKKSDKDFDAEWDDLRIPQEYGLVTYDQNRTITIS